MSSPTGEHGHSDAAWPRTRFCTLTPKTTVLAGASGGRAAVGAAVLTTCAAAACGLGDGDGDGDGDTSGDGDASGEGDGDGDGDGELSGCTVSDEQWRVVHSTRTGVKEA
jgi:hypothetical protein